MVSPGITKMMLSSKTNNQHENQLVEIAKECEIGDWKLLSLLAFNMDPMVFGEFLSELFYVLKDNQLRKKNQTNVNPIQNERRDSIR